MPPTVLFLNGTSSAGKTSIAQAFQRLYAEPCLYASVDAFIFMFADHVRANDALRRQVLPPVISAFHRSLPTIAQCGFPVIVDHVIEARPWVEECAVALAGVRAYFVGVHCPLEVLEDRERKRGDRQIGFARWQFERVHAFGPYDLSLDSSLLSPDESAKKLIALLHSNQKPEAFSRIRTEATEPTTRGGRGIS
jgi:chloramphenicol 3-O phosphotransferase